MNKIKSDHQRPSVDRSFPLLDNVDQAVEIVSQYLMPHTIKINHANKEAQAHLEGVLLDNVALLDIQYGADVNIYPGESDCFLISMSFDGISEKKHGPTKFTHTSNNIIISAPNSLSHVYMNNKGHDISVAVNQKALERYLSDVLDIEIQTPLQFEEQSDSNCEAGKIWKSTLSNIFTQAKIAPELFDNDRIIKQHSASIMEILLSMFKHNYSNQMHGDIKKINPWHVRQAKRYIEAHLCSPINMSELASEVGVSTRTLQSGFKKFECISPADYVRERRLQHLHQALIQADPHEHITDIMIEQGIASFGRFAQYYQKRFGCRPSDTLKAEK